MDFNLTKEQEMIRNMVQDFAEKEVKPIADEIDLNCRYPQETIDKMAKLYLLSLTIPKEYGGVDADGVSYSIAIEEISRACASTGIIVGVHNSLGSSPLVKYGTDDQKAKYLPRLATGEMLGAFALTESGAGSDAAAQQTVAVREGDEYILNGTKVFCTNGPQAGLINVFAMTDRSKGTRGISCFLVEKDTPGFEIGHLEEKMGIKGSHQSELIFEDCRIPVENLIGKEGRGFGIAMQSLDAGRVGVAAQALGIAQGALDESIIYAKQREQFGKPIARLQAIQWMIAEMATEIQAARHLVYHAGFMKTSGQRYSKEAAMAKLYASEVAGRATDKAVQIHGGYGYVREYAVERYFRDAKITQIYEGTSEVQKLVIAGTLLR